MNCRFQNYKQNYFSFFLQLPTKALLNWDFFELAEWYESGRFQDASETRFPKPKPNFEVRKLTKGPKSRKIGFRFRESGFRAFPKFRILWILEVRKLVKTKRFELSQWFAGAYYLPNFTMSHTVTFYENCKLVKIAVI